MASIDRSDPVILGHVLAEHRDLFNLMLSVRSTFAADGPPTLELRTALLTCLKELRRHLAEHFAQEERGGFLEEAVTRVPRLSAAVRSILGQHPALLAELDALIREFENTPLQAAAWAAAWSRADRAFEVFSDHMTAHERRENAVVQEGYNEDLGLME
ncbi:MAG: hemerythrin domain-containing protein [Planctomycetia bacterium]